MDGLAQMQRNLRRIGKNVDRDKEQALSTSAELILQEALLRTPEDTGELKRSARIVTDEEGTRVEYTAPYAVFVHEDLGAEHDQGQAKFLESALKEKSAEVKDNLSTTLGQSLRK